MSAARSAWQREADTWAVRASRSSSVSLAVPRGRKDAVYLFTGDGVRHVQVLTASRAGRCDGAARGGSCLLEPLTGREATSMNTPRSQKRSRRSRSSRPSPPAAVRRPPGASRNATMPGRNIAILDPAGDLVARHGSRGDLAPVSSAGISAATSASSA